VESDDNVETEDQSSDDEDGEVDDLLDEALDNDMEEEEHIMTDSKRSVTEVCTAPATAEPVSLLPCFALFSLFINPLTPTVAICVQL